MYKILNVKNLTQEQKFLQMQNFGRTILKNVVLLDNDKIKAKEDLQFVEKLQVIAIYKYNTNEIIKI